MKTNKILSLIIAFFTAISLSFSSFAMTVGGTSSAGSAKPTVDDPAIYNNSEKEIINFFQSEENKEKYPGLSIFWSRGFYPIPYCNNGSLVIDYHKIYEKAILENGSGYSDIRLVEPHDYPYKALGFSILPVEINDGDTLETVIQREYPSLVSSIEKTETYKGRKIASWTGNPQEYTFSSGVFLYGKYLIVVEALGTLREEPWKNEYLDLFEFKHIELPGNVSAESDLYYGDIDRDGRITPVDALFALQLSVWHIGKYPVPEPNPFISYKEPESEFKLIGDANKDNMIGVSDALMILQYSVGKITAF